MQTRLLPDAPQRCIDVRTVLRPTSGLGSCKPICHAVLMGRKLKVNNVLCIYRQSFGIICFEIRAEYVTFLIEKKIFAKRM